MGFRQNLERLRERVRNGEINIITYPITTPSQSAPVEDPLPFLRLDEARAQSQPAPSQSAPVLSSQVKSEVPQGDGIYRDPSTAQLVVPSGEVYDQEVEPYLMSSQELESLTPEQIQEALKKRRRLPLHWQEAIEEEERKGFRKKIMWGLGGLLIILSAFSFRYFTKPVAKIPGDFNQDGRQDTAELYGPRIPFTNRYIRSPKVYITQEDGSIKTLDQLHEERREIQRKDHGNRRNKLEEELSTEYRDQEAELAREYEEITSRALGTQK